MPTLILSGKADGIVAPSYADNFARRLAHARVTLLDGIGHLPHFEQAAKVAGLVGEFLRDRAVGRARGSATTIEYGALRLCLPTLA